jgi:predicted esterase
MAYEARLRAEPGTVTQAGPTGRHALDVGSRRNSYFYVPPGYDPARPAPVALMLHGAGGHAQHGLDLLQHLADDNGLILVAPASTGQTWDVIINRAYGPDVALIDEGLGHVFNNYAVDPTRIAIGGFSDGASYALSLGLTNGKLFTHVIAFSPGFVVPLLPRGRPQVFISHGTHDDVLPIDRCSRHIVSELRQAGYDLTYQEFDGPHTVPDDIAAQAMRWFLNKA